ncbi:putative neprosin [Helianthus annuus]|nr:putative neprosin [Helianthus annuus]
MTKLNSSFHFVAVLYVFMVARFCYADTSRSPGSRQQVEEVTRHLNKHPVKSIKSPDGDIIDCVHISHQPAFDHPLLKNHTIKMKPNYYPNWINKMSSEASSSLTQLWHSKGKCPKGTIPIIRTKKEDVLNSVKIYRKKNLPKQQHASAYTNGQLYGTQASLNIWNPKIQKSNEYSSAQIWIVGGSFDADLNTIEAGWHVYPELYGDNNTRLFIHWTSDGYRKTGCYNLKCSGFIQTDNRIAIGGGFIPVMTQFGGVQYEFTLTIWKDQQSGDWWLQWGSELVIGYWPSSLFSYLSENAWMIQWGGEVVNFGSHGQHTTTQMGSGHFPRQGFGKASYIRHIEILDESGNSRTPKDLNTIADQNSCYDISTNIDDDFLYYGGPGRNKNCP